MTLGLFYLINKYLIRLSFNKLLLFKWYSEATHLIHLEIHDQMQYLICWLDSGDFHHPLSWKAIGLDQFWVVILNLGVWMFGWKKLRFET